MRIRAELHIGNHPARREGFVGSAFHNGKPHAIGLIKIPLEYIPLYPRLNNIFQALPSAAQGFVMEEGELALSHDFTFDAEYRQGIGLVLEGLSLDVVRLKASEKEQVASWLQKRYGVEAEGDDHRLTQLCAAFEAELIADMTFAGMSRNYFLALVREEAEGVAHPQRITRLIRPARASTLLASLKQRNIGLDKSCLLAFHKEVTQMRDGWPTFRGDNFGEVSDTEGAVIFFKGFRVAGNSCIKAGPYAFTAAWAEGGIRYDANGIAKDAAGRIIAPKAIIPENEYICLPSGVLVMEHTGSEAIAILDRFFDANPAIYDGFDLNCAGVSGRAIFGESFVAIPQRGVKNDLLWEKEHLYHLEEMGLLPAGMEYHAVDTLFLPREHDHNCLRASTRQVSARLHTARLRQALATIRSRQKAKVHPELYLDYPRHRLAPAQLPLGNERRAARKGAYPCVALFPPFYASSLHGPPCIGVPPPAPMAG